MGRVYKTREKREYVKSDYFVARTGNYLSLSAAVRDAVLPKRRVDVCQDDKCLSLRPVEDNSGYAMTVSPYSSQARVFIGKTLKKIDIPIGVRFPCVKQEGGSIRVLLSEGEK